MARSFVGTIPILPIVVACAASPRRDVASSVAPDPVWHDRVVQVFDILTKQSLHPAPPETIAAAGWRALGEGSRQDSSADALANTVASGVASHALDSTRAWSVIEAMVDATDNGHTQLFSGDAMKQIIGSIRGLPFTSPGIVLGWTPERQLVVTEVLAEGPASQAGIAVGDVVTALNGKRPRSTWSVGALEGVPEGSTTTISIVRDGVRSEIRYRARLYAHPIASHRTIGEVGIIRSYLFALGDDPAHNIVELARSALADFDTTHVTGLVIDLRGNQGGAGCEYFAPLFTDAEPLLFAGPRWEKRGRPDTEPPFAWPNPHTLWPTQRPIAVLIDDESVSCAEMAALILHEHAHARVFGQPSGGDLDLPARPPVDLGEHYALWFPDVPVYAPSAKDAPPAARVQPDEIIPNRTIADLRAGRDAQLDAAMRWLAAQAKPVR